LYWLLEQFAVLSSQSSFIVGTEAQPYYGIDNNYEKSYGKENYKSTIDSSVDLNKIKCNNINININGQGGNGNTTNGDSSTKGNETNHESKKFHKDGFAFVCINNNNNIVTGNGGNATAGDGNATDECPEAEDIEACFEEFLAPNYFELLTDTLASPAGLTVEIAGQDVTLRSFADICEALEGLTLFQFDDALDNILLAIDLDVIDGRFYPCVGEALGIFVPPPTPP
jgi:hypothetical protein